jgi:uncharacterized protein with HEPN domain
MKPLSTYDSAYLWDILNACEKLEGFIKGLSLDDFLADAKTQSAVERQIEIIGEVAKKLTDDCRSLFPNLPCSSIPPRTFFAKKCLRGKGFS